MGDEGEFEESREKTSGAETVYSQDPPKKSNGYGLSEKRKLLSQETSNDDKEPTTPVPTTDNEDSAPKFAGITQYSNVKLLLHNIIHDVILSNRRLLDQAKWLILKSDLRILSMVERNKAKNLKYIKKKLKNRKKKLKSKKKRLRS